MLRSGGHIDTDDHHDDTTVGIPSGSSVSRKYSRSHSESSSQSQTDNVKTINRSKKYLISNRKQPKSNLIHSKTSANTHKTKTTDVIDYFDNNEQQMKSNENWGDWEDAQFNSNNHRYHQSYDRRTNTNQQNFSEDLSQKSNRNHEQMNDVNRTKQSSKSRSNGIYIETYPKTLYYFSIVLAQSRSSEAQTTSKSENKTVTNKAQPAWRPLSPPRPIESNDPTPKEAVSYKSTAKPNESNDRRQTAPVERKQRYINTTTTPINTASIPPLMSVRSDVPPTTVVSTTTSKHFKNSNQSQRQDYNSSSHYSQRNDFYNETNDAAWGNDEDYYDDETGYYDSTIQTHQRHHHSMGYHSNLHHRGYIALGSYGRYRRGGTFRHQQQYNTYNVSATSATSPSQLNTSTGSKTKKTTTNRTNTTTITKKPNESLEQEKPVVESAKPVTEEIVVVKKPSPWSLEKKPSTTEEPSKPVETPTEVEKTKEITEQKPDNELSIVTQPETETTTTTNKKQLTPNTKTKTTRDQQNYHYQNQQQPTTHHRSSYGRSAQDYDSTQVSTHTYYGATHRTGRGSRTARMHDISGGNYYYEHPQQYVSKNISVYSHF